MKKQLVFKLGPVLCFIGRRYARHKNARWRERETERKYSNLSRRLGEEIVLYKARLFVDGQERICDNTIWELIEKRVCLCWSSVRKHSPLKRNGILVQIIWCFNVYIYNSAQIPSREMQQIINM
jgi:hypothetical protein